MPRQLRSYDEAMRSTSEGLLDCVGLRPRGWPSLDNQPPGEQGRVHRDRWAAYARCCVKKAERDANAAYWRCRREGNSYIPGGEPRRELQQVCPPGSSRTNGRCLLPPVRHRHLAGIARGWTRYGPHRSAQPQVIHHTHPSTPGAGTHNVPWSDGRKTAMHGQREVDFIEEATGAWYLPVFLRHHRDRPPYRDMVCDYYWHYVWMQTFYSCLHNIDFWKRAHGLRRPGHGRPPSYRDVARLLSGIRDLRVPGASTTPSAIKRTGKRIPWGGRVGGAEMSLASLALPLAVGAGVWWLVK